MKKLNITKKQFNESKYFTTKYGKLEYVSESGKIYKTSKGHLLKFKESQNDVTIDDFRRMYGNNAAEALIKYCDVKNKDAESVINGSDADMARFENWAKKVLHVDIYDKFSGYDYDSDLDDSRSEVDESSNDDMDIDSDPAYVCPWCGSHDCEFKDAEEPGITDGYFDGAQFDTKFQCNSCGETYIVKFEMNVIGVS